MAIYIYGRWWHHSKHGVGILLNKRCKRKIIQTKYVSERMVTTTIKYDQRKIELTSVYCPDSGYADRHIEKMYKHIETNSNKRNTPGS